MKKIKNIIESIIFAIFFLVSWFGTCFTFIGFIDSNDKVFLQWLIITIVSIVIVKRLIKNI